MTKEHHAVSCSVTWKVTFVCDSHCSSSFFCMFDVIFLVAISSFWLIFHVIFLVVSVMHAWLFGGFFSCAFFFVCVVVFLVFFLFVGWTPLWMFWLLVLFFFCLFGIILLNDRMLYLLVLILYVSCLASSC